MANPVKIEAYGRLLIHWDDEPTIEDLDADRLFNYFIEGLHGRVIAGETTRFNGRAKSSTKFTPKGKIKKR